MIANYHTHTARCHHAVGTEEEYIQTAITRGMTTLGFSDHAPFIYRGGHVSPYRMAPEELGDYFATLGALREKYAGVIDVPIGFELEFYPELFANLFPLMAPYRPDYFVLGLHWIGVESLPGAEDSYDPYEGEDRLEAYADRLIRAIRSGIYSYVAHPDFCYFDMQPHKRSTYAKIMRPVIREAMAADIPLEYNLLGQAYGRHYPKTWFWEEVADLGAKCILGCDAHDKDRVGNPVEIAAAKAHLGALGITPVATAALRAPTDTPYFRSFLS